MLTFYQLHFQVPVADAELAADPRASVRRLLAATSGGRGAPPMFALAPGQGFLDLCPEPDVLPAWLTEADLDVYAAAFARSGFTGGLAWYRNIGRNWELTAPWHDARIAVPALYLAGAEDLVLAGTSWDAVVAALRAGTTVLRDAVLLPGCGHWTQQERPAEVDAALLGFIGSL